MPVYAISQCDNLGNPTIWLEFEAQNNSTAKKRAIRYAFNMRHDKRLYIAKKIAQNAYSALFYKSNWGDKCWSEVASETIYYTF